MEVFTVVERRAADSDDDDDAGGFKLCYGGSSARRRPGIQVPFGIAVTVQAVIALGLTGLLTWNFLDLDAARNGLPVFGRLVMIVCLLASFYFQKTIYTGHVEIQDGHLVTNLILYVTSLLTGVTFWLVQMQYSSSLSPGVANFSSVEPIILVTALIVGVYTLRKLMTHYDNHRTEELDIYTRPLFPQVLVVFALLEAIFGLVFGVSMNFVVSSDYEFTKRCGCLVGIFVSGVINELGIMFSKESRSALMVKTAGFFINLMCTQMTWWLSYYKERQLTLYGLGVGFLTLIFGVLYTVEMSLQTAQLNSHNPDGHGPRSTFLQPKSSGDSKKGNNEEDDEDAASVDTESMAEPRPVRSTAGQLPRRYCDDVPTVNATTSPAVDSPASIATGSGSRKSAHTIRSQKIDVETRAALVDVEEAQLARRKDLALMESLQQSLLRKIKRIMDQCADPDLSPEESMILNDHRKGLEKDLEESIEDIERAKVVLTFEAESAELQKKKIIIRADSELNKLDFESDGEEVERESEHVDKTDLTLKWAEQQQMTSQVTSPFLSQVMQGYGSPSSPPVTTVTSTIVPAVAPFTA
ncbi:hypothetical protein Fcan01_08999 [Folsomia candida]|uniref:Uncharacterized protein n=1 Tax=Folsomia candida TaxID=158441 RepID=A0A226EGT9_FOLCA|nr:hypothetical protein Fcan01_08999 [Folsomia candida]